MDLDKIRDQWHEMSYRVSKLENDSLRLAVRLAAGKAMSTKQRLGKEYFRAAMLGLLLPVISPAIVYVIGAPVWIAICYAAFGLIMCVIDLYLRSVILSADYLSLPVIDSIAKTVEIRKKMQQARILSLSLGLCIVLSLAYAILPQGNEYMTYGFYAGIIIGGTLGLIKWHQMNKLSRQMLKELESARSSESEDIDEDDLREGLK